MEDAARLRVQYLLAMAQNEVVLQQLNLHQFIRGRFRWRRGFRRRRIWRRTWLNPARRRTFGIFDQLLVELRREDPSTFRKFLCMPPELYDEILERVRGRIWRQHTWFREPLNEGLKLAATLRHLVSGTMYSDMQYGWRVPENTLSVVVREVCQAICEEYADEVMTAPSTPDGWRQLSDGFYWRWNFPHCVAAIDGKHVAIRKPPLSGSLYYNYKGFFSIILLAIVDSDYTFVWCDVGGKCDTFFLYVWHNIFIIVYVSIEYLASCRRVKQMTNIHRQRQNNVLKGTKTTWQQKSGRRPWGEIMCSWRVSMWHPSWSSLPQNKG